jgi:hypothetical protein
MICSPLNTFSVGRSAGRTDGAVGRVDSGIFVTEKKQESDEKERRRNGKQKEKQKEEQKDVKRETNLKHLLMWKTEKEKRKSRGEDHR